MEIQNITFLFTLIACYKRSTQLKNILQKAKCTVIVRLLHHALDYLITKIQRASSRDFFSSFVDNSDNRKIFL